MGFAVALLVIIVMINIYNYLVFLLYKHVRVPQEALMTVLNLNHWFIRKKDIDDIIRRGADPNYKNGLPLCLALKNHAGLRIIKALIDNGADINIICPDNNGIPLFYAIVYGHVKAFKLLMTLGADASYKIKDGSNLLFCAIAANQYKIARMLINEYKFDINSRNNDGTTVLMAACMCCRLNYVFLKELMLLPVDFEATDNAGKTYLSYFYTNKYLRFYRFFKLI